MAKYMLVSDFRLEQERLMFIVESDKASIMIEPVLLLAFAIGGARNETIYQESGND
jgi:hypothetical protein